MYHGDGIIDFIVRYYDKAISDKKCDPDGSNHYLEAFIRNNKGKWDSTWCLDSTSEEQWDYPTRVWDLNMDGKAEIIAETDDNIRLSVINGEDGTIISNVPNSIGSDNREIWYLNVAYLDGRKPYLAAMSRDKGSATNLAALTTFSWSDGDLVEDVPANRSVFFRVFLQASSQATTGNFTLLAREKIDTLSFVRRLRLRAKVL